DAPIHLAEHEDGVLGGDGEVAGEELRERPAEAVAVHHRNGRLREQVEAVEAPFRGRLAGPPAPDRIVVQLAEELLEILAGAPGIPRDGEDHHLRLRVGLELAQDLRHLEVHLRVHAVALLGPIQDHPGDAVLALDLDGLVLGLQCHRSAPPSFDRASPLAGTGIYCTRHPARQQSGDGSEQLSGKASRPRYARGEPLGNGLSDGVADAVRWSSGAADSAVGTGGGTRRSSSRATARAAATGTATSAPAMPSTWPPIRRERTTASGCSRTARSMIFGTRKLFSSCWITT